MRMLLVCCAATMLLGCNANRTAVTRYAAGGTELEVSMRVRPGASQATAMRYFLSPEPKQIEVQVRIIEPSSASLRNLGVWNGLDFQQPVTLNDTTPSKPRLGLGLGLGTSSGGRHGGSGHPPGCACSACKGGGGTSVGTGVGVGLPLDFGDKPVRSVSAILNAPKLVELNNEPARLHLGVVIQKQSGGPLTLALLPMSARSGDVVQEPPGLLTQTVVQDGHSVVIAGLRSTEEAEKAPLLRDIPMLGRLFKTDANDKQRTELVVFVTPRVVPSADE